MPNGVKNFQNMCLSKILFHLSFNFRALSVRWPHYCLMTQFPFLAFQSAIQISILCTWSLPHAQIIEWSTGNSKKVPKKSTSLGRMMGFRQYTVRPRCEPWSLQPACIKFSSFMPILDMSIVTTPIFIISEGHTWEKVGQLHFMTQC